MLKQSMASGRTSYRKCCVRFPWYLWTVRTLNSCDDILFFLYDWVNLTFGHDWPVTAIKSSNAQHDKHSRIVGAWVVQKSKNKTHTNPIDFVRKNDKSYPDIVVGHTLALFSDTHTHTRYGTNLCAAIKFRIIWK